MYEPTQTEIDKKVKESLGKMLMDDDFLIDALIYCLPLIKKTLTCYSSDLIDARFDLREAIEKHITGLRNLEEEARQFLIAEKNNETYEDYRKEIVRDFDRTEAKSINRGIF